MKIEKEVLNEAVTDARVLVAILSLLTLKTKKYDAN